MHRISAKPEKVRGCIMAGNVEPPRTVRGLSSFDPKGNPVAGSPPLLFTGIIREAGIVARWKSGQSQS